MKHLIKKIKFSKGRDSRNALIRKLTLNFIQNGKIETTFSRAKALKSTIDSLIYKAIQNKQSDRNVLLRKLGDKTVVEVLTKEIAPSFPGRIGGYVKLRRLGIRQGDNAETAQLIWSEEIKKYKKASPKEETKENKNKDSKTVDKKVLKKKTEKKVVQSK